MTDLRTSLAQSAYGALSQRPLAQAKDQGATDAFSQAVQGFAQTLGESERLSRAALTTGADPHALVTALAQTELAVETAVTIRNRVVEAYQEILRMPV